jgi:hypothetical protein
VFFLPGLGRLIFQAITQRDLIVVESVVMLLVFAVIVVTFLVDLAYAGSTRGCGGDDPPTILAQSLPHRRGAPRCSSPWRSQLRLDAA